MTSSTLPSSAGVYREAVRAAYANFRCESFTRADEPSPRECSDTALMFSRFERLMRAAESGRELLDPELLPLLEGGAQQLREQAEDAEGMEARQLLPVAEALVERLKAHKPVLCLGCNAPATHRGPSDEPSCARCAQYAVAHDLGESFAAGEMIEAFAEMMPALTVTRDELAAAFADVAQGNAAFVGAFARHREALDRERAADEDGLGETDRWRSYYTPIEGVGA